MYSRLCLIVFCACANAAPQLPLQTLFAEVPTRVLSDDSANNNTTFAPSTDSVAISAISEMVPEPSTEPAISSEDTSTVLVPSELVSEGTDEIQTTVNPSGSGDSTEGPLLDVVSEQQKRTESVPVAEGSSTEAVIIVEPVMNLQSSTSNAELVFPVSQGETPTSTVPSTTAQNSTVKNETSPRTQQMMPEINVTVELNLPTDLHVSAESLFIEPTIINGKDADFEPKMIIKSMKLFTPERTSEKPVEEMNRTASYIQMPRGFAMAVTTEEPVSTTNKNPEPSSEIAITVSTSEPSTQSTTEISSTTEFSKTSTMVSSTEPPMEVKTSVTVPTTEVSTKENVPVKNVTTESPKPDPEVSHEVNKLAEMENPMEPESSVETDHVSSSYTHVVRKIFKRPFGFLNPSIRARKKYSVPIYTKSVVSHETNVSHPKIVLPFPSKMTPGTRSRSYAHATAYSNRGNYHATVVSDTETDV